MVQVAMGVVVEMVVLEVEDVVPEPTQVLVEMELRGTTEAMAVRLLEQMVPLPAVEVGPGT